MTRTELIIQVLKIAIGLAFGAYFVWWSLEVLDRLAPENEAPTPAVGHIMKVHAARLGSQSYPLGSTKTARQHTATPPRARPRWRCSPRAAAGSDDGSGRSSDWLKMKNLAAPAVKREAEEDWAR
jgi:hypothetical protein